jgi:hypothetical protein
MRRALRLFVVSILGPALGCAYGVPLSIAEVETKHLAFLRDGETTREEILLKFGDPTGIFEDGRILTFRLEASETAVIPVRREYDRDLPGVTHWRLANLSLVAVFDDKNVLRRHALVPVKS